MSEGLPTAPFDSSATHASRNPLQPIIEPRQNTQPKSTPSEKLDKRVRREEARRAKEEYRLALDEIHDAQQRRILEVAEQHGVKVKAVEREVRGLSTVKGSARPPTLKNALFHRYANEVNGGEHVPANAR